MELIIIRHALPIRIDEADGAADPWLSEDGLAQAKHMAAYLASERLDALYTSPMRRAVETAAPLAELTGLSPVVVDDVAEHDRDASSYVPVEELKAAADGSFERMLDGTGTDDQEAQAFYDRVVGALEAIIDRHPGQTVAVTCHGGVINAYIAHVLGLSFTLPGTIYPNYTSLHRFAASSRGHRSVLTINETAHLRGTGLPVGLFRRD